MSRNSLQSKLYTPAWANGNIPFSVGSAAGVALMGQAKGMYTFMTHLKWLPAIGLGYLASVGIHFLLNADLF